MLMVLGRANSINVQKVLWTCEEIGKRYERTDMGGEFGGLSERSYLSLNPNGLVPCVIDGDTVLWESNSIVRYLCASYSPGLLWPNDPAQRAAADKWMDWQFSTLWPEIRTIFIQLVRTPPELRKYSLIQEAVKRASDALAILNNHLGQEPHLGGEDHLTMGDLVVGPVVYRWFNMDFERREFPNVRLWYDRLTARPAFRRAVMLPLG
ncbi:glutathione S-transferase family protein [Allomesorhizobium camelthorni]|uniref:Glutathione S-transferase n=1 Tax=Allomesorhizobium camelthorni TaxID=475069 RepID=A0A6G4WFU5_9HYPH|nr:glutathione S-transferase [Mesorhizobium camelthorni]NGO53464.1 glutathione S-transferase [Mesorhizobium camelthorni]